MKRLACLLLIGAIGAAHLASAEDENPNKAKGKGNAAVVKRTGGNNVRVSPTMHGNQNFRGGQNFRVQQNTQQTARINQGNRTYIKPHNVNPHVNVNTGVASANLGNTNNVVQSKKWHQGGNWNANGKWQKNLHNNVNVNVNSGRNWSINHNWDRQRRDRSYWRSRYNRFALFGGGYYYWNSGYWYPAYGYDPQFSTYSYDGPIYSYNDQDPGQVVAQVQTALLRRGYNPGGVDGTYGPMTRNALLGYQRDNGLPDTGEIDEQTLASLGLQ
jgi:hypothetical protein